MKYIAYGSNMSTSQMAYRCPDAKLIGTGRLLGSQLEFFLHATVERSQIKNASVPVAVWEISRQDERFLDRYEGFPSYYAKDEWLVHMDDGTQIKGMIYLMNQKRDCPPTTVYYNGIRDAYIELGLCSQIKRVLQPALNRSIRHTKR